VISDKKFVLHQRCRARCSSFLDIDWRQLEKTDRTRSLNSCSGEEHVPVLSSFSHPCSPPPVLNLTHRWIHFWTQTFNVRLCSRDYNVQLFTRTVCVNMDLNKWWRRKAIPREIYFRFYNNVLRMSLLESSWRDQEDQNNLDWDAFLEYRLSEANLPNNMSITRFNLTCVVWKHKTLYMSFSRHTLSISSNRVTLESREREDRDCTQSPWPYFGPKEDIIL